MIARCQMRCRWCTARTVPIELRWVIAGTHATMGFCRQRIPMIFVATAREWTVTKMDEYIKREAALALVQPDAPEDEKAAVTIATAKKLVRSIVRRTPAADVAPVVHGHFVHDGPRFAGGVDWWHCSSCGRLASGAETRFDYCPWCGARMDGGACNQVCKYNTPDRGCVAGELGSRCDLANVTGERGHGEAG